jgi:hypothetical protein
MKNKFRCPLSRLFLFLAALALSLPARAVTLKADEKGISIQNGSQAELVIGYPEIGDGAAHKIVNKVPGPNSAVITYNGGGTCNITLTPNGEIQYSFSGVPSDVTAWHTSSIIEVSYQQGGTWKMDSAAAAPFPPELGPKPQFFQNHANEFQLTDAQGKSLSFKMPPFSYDEMTDNRKWGWAVYAWKMSVPFTGGGTDFKLTVSGGVDATFTPKKLIDEFGQRIEGEWPTKVHSLDELMADVKSEQAYYAGLTPPARDTVGGLPGSKEKLGLNATGFFHVEQKNGKWVLVDPSGNAFFHMGICAFGPGDDYTYVAGRESIYTWLPPLESEFKTAYLPPYGSQDFSFYLANVIRKYGQPYEKEPFQARMIDRVKKFGFNSIGAFSGDSQASHTANFPFVLSLPLGPWAGEGLQGIKEIPGVHGTWDPFDAGNQAKVEANFAASLPKCADDPLLIGYFLTNEPLYEDIPKVVPTLKGSQYPCKHALVQMLSDKYKTIDAFNQAWGMSVKTFDELNDTPLIANNKTAFDDVHDYTGLFFETYFKLVADTFHKYDTHHMLIGNRFQPGTINNEQLCRICGKYMDIVSFNYYTNAIDTDFINRINKWTGGKPMIFSEFFWPSPKASGLVGGAGLATETERGQAYRYYVEKAASLGYVVGIEWFTLIDQATTGRWFSKYNGEQANSGIFSVADRPYKDCVAGMIATNYGIYDIWLDGKAPFAFDNPLFSEVGDAKRVASVPRALGPIAIDGGTVNWPGIPPEIVSAKRTVVGENPGDFEATFRLCWDDTNLYVLATVHDDTPMKNTHDVAALWQGDALEIYLGSQNTDQGGPPIFGDQHLVIGAPKAGPAPYLFGSTPTQPTCDTIVVPGADGKSYTIEAAIPWTALATKPQIGQSLLFDLAVDNSDDGATRNLQLMWNGTAKNSGDRTHWGHIKLGQ